jgi:hypothetical protein
MLISLTVYMLPKLVEAEEFNNMEMNGMSLILLKKNILMRIVN